MEPTTPEAFDPGFTWDAELDPYLINNIARLGDDEMRRTVATHRSITDEAGETLLSFGDRSLARLLLGNPAVSADLFEKAAKPRKAAHAANRARKSAAAEAYRTSFITPEVAAA